MITIENQMTSYGEIPVTTEKINNFYLGFTKYSNGSLAVLAFEDLSDQWPDIITTNNGYIICNDAIQLRSDGDSDAWKNHLLTSGIINGHYTHIPSGYIYIYDFLLTGEFIDKLKELDFYFDTKKGE